ncbi:MAG: tRNA pseudouridine(38-40) synthase TruA [Acidobacteriota bacterium]
MATWRLDVEYDGTRYRGWQVQSNARTIQGEMQTAARQLFSSRPEIYGSGRTDAGVHAIGQVVHLKVPDLKTDLTPRQIQLGFNDLLPYDINVKKVTNAPDAFHARHDAVARYYLYQIATRRTAFGKQFVWWIKDRLDIAAMSRAAEAIVGRHDFYSLSERDDARDKSTVVTVEHSNIFLDGDLICFRIGAGHFLWKMVRRIVGVLVEVGRGNMDQAEFERLLKFKTAAAAQFTAPPSGLYLEKVLYAGDRPPESRDAALGIP